MQTAWEAGDHTPAVEPKVFCKEAIRAASDLVIDPRRASWVEKHWGTNYLHRENRVLPHAGHCGTDES